VGLRETVVQALAGDGTIAWLLPGGVWSALEISRQNTPAAFDANKELQPCALVSLEAEAPDPTFDTSTRSFVVLHFYQRYGYDKIDLALERSFQVLNRQKLLGMWDMRHADDVRDQHDDVLDAALHVSRYVVTRLR
jgi:hypothetical protein